jgi:hypothetical protein
VEALPLRLSVERRRGRDRSGGGFGKHLGFAPVTLGKLNEGGWLVHARGRTWGQLIFQDCSRRSGNGFAVHCQRCCFSGPVHESPRGLSHNPRSGSGEGFDVPFPPKSAGSTRRRMTASEIPPPPFERRHWAQTCLTVRRRPLNPAVSMASIASYVGRRWDSSPAEPSRFTSASSRQLRSRTQTSADADDP